MVVPISWRIPAHAGTISAWVYHIVSPSPSNRFVDSGTHGSKVCTDEIELEFATYHYVSFLLNKPLDTRLPF